MPLRVGLLGLGDAGRHHRRAIEACPDVVWTALGARDPLKAPVVPADVAVVSTDELLAGGCCDAIVIATPDALHAEHARRALARGHPALADKIPAVREPPHGIDRAAEVALRFATGALAHVSVAITHRATPRLIVAGELGEIEAIGTLGARGGGEVVHRAGRDGISPIAFVA